RASVAVIHSSATDSVAVSVPAEPGAACTLSATERAQQSFVAPTSTRSSDDAHEYEWSSVGTPSEQAIRTTSAFGTVVVTSGVTCSADADGEDAVSETSRTTVSVPDARNPMLAQVIL